MHRLLLSRGGNLYTRMALGMPLHDATGGYRAYRMRRPRQDRRGESVASQGYCFQVELAWRAHRTGFRIVEVPITFAERERGASKMSSQHRPEALWRVTVWGAQARKERGHAIGCGGASAAGSDLAVTGRWRGLLEVTAMTPDDAGDV